MKQGRLIVLLFTFIFSINLYCQGVVNPKLKKQEYEIKFLNKFSNIMTTETGLKLFGTDFYSNKYVIESIDETGNSTNEIVVSKIVISEYPEDLEVGWLNSAKPENLYFQNYDLNSNVVYGFYYEPMSDGYYIPIRINFLKENGLEVAKLSSEKLYSLEIKGEYGIETYYPKQKPKQLKVYGANLVYKVSPASGGYDKLLIDDRINSKKHLIDITNGIVGTWDYNIRNYWYQDGKHYIGIHRNMKNFAFIYVVKDGVIENIIYDKEHVENFSSRNLDNFSVKSYFLPKNKLVLIVTHTGGSPNIEFSTDIYTIKAFDLSGKLIWSKENEIFTYINNIIECDGKLIIGGATTRRGYLGFDNAYLEIIDPVKGKTLNNYLKTHRNSFVTRMKTAEEGFYLAISSDDKYYLYRDYIQEPNMLKFNFFDEKIEEERKKESSNISNSAIKKEVKSYFVYGKYPQSSNTNLEIYELKKMSINELQIMRNEIFARHGYKFKEGGKMHEYFSKEVWYVPLHSNVDDKLTSLEKSNIALIRNEEDTKKK